ncbi:hypothetical protein I4U23_028019 [Adineta vaga]|nr:hypothetical protein I4U23_028019 [Adineta vaga]
MSRIGCCTDVTCSKELTELYECHCCDWMICLKHLLEHVEVVQKEKTKQLDNLRNNLLSVSETLEHLVEKKIQEIEHEKQLVNQAKVKIESSECSNEELKTIFDEINQAIASNAKEETVVKVESSLCDMKNSGYDNEIIEEKVTISDISLLSRPILQEVKSPVYNALDRLIRQCQKVLIIQWTPIWKSLVSILKSTTIFDSTKDEAHDREYNQEHTVNPRTFVTQCPLTFDGAFGLTEEKHGFKFCSSNRVIRSPLLSHFINKHHIKTIHAYRLCRATISELDPATTKLFGENEEVIDQDAFIPCPFSSNTISLIGCCPPHSKKIPCRKEPIRDAALRSHLVVVHRISHSMAAEIYKIYKSKLSKLKSTNNNNSLNSN